MTSARNTIAESSGGVVTRFAPSRGAHGFV
jgi:hypothetical protein